MNERLTESMENGKTALLWGLLWGTFEATAGYLLHLIRIPGFAGWILFPAGFYAMSRVFAASGKQESMFLTAATAAAVKLLDLLIAGHNVASVINPAQAILLESLAVTGVFTFFTADKRIPWTAPVVASLGWRLTFVLLSAVNAGAFGTANLLATGTIGVLRFVALDGLANGLIIAAFITGRSRSFKFGLLNTRLTP